MHESQSGTSNGFLPVPARPPPEHEKQSVRHTIFYVTSFTRVDFKSAHLAGLNLKRDPARQATGDRSRLQVNRSSNRAHSSRGAVGPSGSSMFHVQSVPARLRG